VQSRQATCVLHTLQLWNVSIAELSSLPAFTGTDCFCSSAAFGLQTQVSGCQGSTDFCKWTEVRALLSSLIMLGFIVISSFAVLFSVGLFVRLRYIECITNTQGWGGSFVWTNQAQFDVISWCFTCLSIKDGGNTLSVKDGGNTFCNSFMVSVHSVCSVSRCDNCCWHNGFLGVCRKPFIAALVLVCTAVCCSGRLTFLICKYLW